MEDAQRSLPVPHGGAGDWIPAVDLLGHQRGAFGGGCDDGTCAARPGFVLQILNVLISFAVVTLLFAMIYKLLPDKPVRWGDVWIGASITSLLFTIGKFFIGLYLGKSDVGVAYGAAGSLVVILIWVYYASQIFLFGAEFTAVYAESHGARVAAASGGRPQPLVTLAGDTN